MKSYRKELWSNVPTRRAFINNTPDVQKCIDDSGISESLVFVNAKHIPLHACPKSIRCFFCCSAGMRKSYLTL